MNEGHPNAQLVQQAYHAFSRGEMDIVGAAYADEVSQQRPGSGSRTAALREPIQVW